MKWKKLKRKTKDGAAYSTKDREGHTIYVGHTDDGPDPSEFVSEDEEWEGWWVWSNSLAEAHGPYPTRQAAQRAWVE